MEIARKGAFPDRLGNDPGRPHIELRAEDPATGEIYEHIEVICWWQEAEDKGPNRAKLEVGPRTPPKRRKDLFKYVTARIEEAIALD